MATNMATIRKNRGQPRLASGSCVWQIRRTALDFDCPRAGECLIMLPRRSPTDRLVQRVVGVCASTQDPLDLFERVAGLLRDELSYAAAGWILIDPDTMLMTGVYAEHVDHSLHRELISYELTVDDVNKFWELAHNGTAAAALSEATGGDLARSTRWARIYGPHGYGDELRAVFATGRTAWGHACLTRRAGDPFFAPDEVELLATVAPHIGNGIRACHLLGGLTGGEPVDAPALIVLDDDGEVVSLTTQAREWLGPPEEVDATIALHEVAQRARALAEGAPVDSTGSNRPAMARARARTGEWIIIRGTRLTTDGTNGRSAATALVLEPAARSDLAPLLLAVHELTNREREVTQLLLMGMSIAQIAGQLWITPETLRGHVKSVYAKLGVSSRPELAALLSHEPRSRVRSDAPAARRSQ